MCLCICIGLERFLYYNLAILFRGWDYSSILCVTVSPFMNIGVNRLCISIVFVLKRHLLKKMKYLYLPACHVIINQNQRNHEHVILYY